MDSAVATGVGDRGSETGTVSVTWGVDVAVPAGDCSSAESGEAVELLQAIAASIVMLSNMLRGRMAALFISVKVADVPWRFETRTALRCWG